MAKKRITPHSVRVRIYSVHQYATRSVRVFFEITNKGKVPIRVAKRYTPLEGLLHDSLIVKRNGKVIEYDGLHAKRLAASPAEMLELKPDQSKSAEVDLSQGYSLQKGGNITVAFKRKNLKIEVPGASNTPIKVSTPVAKFRVAPLPKASPRLTIGERDRQMAQIALETNPTEVPLLPIIEGSNGRDQIIIDAHRACFENCDNANVNINANPERYATWFGERTGDRVDQVRGVYQDILSRMRGIRFTYKCNSDDQCGGDVIASTSKGSSTIYLCAQFWNLDPSGSESQVGCLVHEHSHASGGTIDIPKDGGGLGPQYYRDLASENPNQAVSCAYNFEYYAVS